MKKGQGAIMDALFFMLICGGAAALMFQVASMYGQSTASQTSAIYNYEYASNALIALHYVEDGEGTLFWRELEDKLGSDSPEEKVTEYIDDNTENIWEEVENSSPSRYTFLCFRGLNDFCYPGEGSDNVYYNQTTGGTTTDKIVESDLEGRTAYSSSVAINYDYDVVLKVYY